MAKDNIYDLTISEIILRLEDLQGASLNTARLELSSSIGEITVPENYNNGAVVFTSTIVNMPTGYSIVASSHVITYPTAEPNTVGSATPLSGVPTSVILGAVGSTFVVTSTVDITDGVTPVTLNASLTITSVLPTYYGMKTAPVGAPDSTSLSEISSSLDTFEITTNGVPERLYVAIPTASGGANFKGVAIEPNKVWIPASDFTQTTVGSHEFWVLNYDTIFTEPHKKTFTIKTT